MEGLTCKPSKWKKQNNNYLNYHPEKDKSIINLK